MIVVVVAPVHGTDYVCVMVSLFALFHITVKRSLGVPFVVEEMVRQPPRPDKAVGQIVSRKGLKITELN